MKKQPHLYEQTRKPQNSNISGLKNQIVELNHDYQGMLRARQESKKQMDAKFQDIHRKIKGNQEFAQAQARRVFNTLQAFGSKFNNKMKTVENQVSTAITQHKDTAQQNRSNMFDRLQNIKAMIDKEREDRIKQANQVFGDLKAYLNKINQFYETEKADRIQAEKGMLRYLDDSHFEIKEGLDKAQTIRSRSSVQMQDDIKNGLKRQNKSNEAFQKKSMGTFNSMRTNLEEEMDERFDKQDEINDNLSNYLKTYQETLRIIGESS